MPVDTRTLVVVAIVSIIIGAALGFTFASFTAPKPPEKKEECPPCPPPPECPECSPAGLLPSEIPVGALLPLTGELSSFGKRNENGLKMAVEDVNAYLKRIGLNVQFKLLVEDTKLEEQEALARLQTLAAQGVKVVIGPMASSEVSAIKSFADSNQIVIVSQSSTAPSLAVPNDYVFRFVPTDLFQGKALARLVQSLGYSNVAVIYRGDDWGDGLFKSFKERFEELGGKVEGVRYDPKAKDLSPEVRKLSDIVKSLGEKTAVLQISFEDDGVQILKLAAQDEVLSKVAWFGTDGQAQSSKVKDQAGEEAVKLGGLICTLYTTSKNRFQEEFAKRFRERYGEDPDAYTLNAYDAFWVVALTIIQVGEYDGPKIAAALPEVAAKYFGVTGNALLDENGDRAGGDYALWKVVKTDTGYKWVQAGIYNFATDSITFFKE